MTYKHYFNMIYVWIVNFRYFTLKVKMAGNEIHIFDLMLLNPGESACYTNKDVYCL